MTFLQAAISGIVQGIAEFLPISSSGHLVILHKLMGFNEPEILFDIFLHLGTLLAIFIVFGKDILESITSNRRIGFLILLSSIVTFIFVLIFVKNIEAAFENVKLVGMMLVVTGTWLLLSNLIRFGAEGLTGFKAVLIGLSQAIAALPGISRSGATISTGLFLGLDAQTSAKFSFLLSIPVIIGAFLFKIKETGFNFAVFNINYLVGFVVSCIIGIISLKLLLRTLYRNKFHWFGVYCIVVGILVVVFLKA